MVKEKWYNQIAARYLLMQFKTHNIAQGCTCQYYQSSIQNLWKFIHICICAWMPMWGDIQIENEIFFKYVSFPVEIHRWQISNV